MAAGGMLTMAIRVPRWRPAELFAARITVVNDEQKTSANHIDDLADPALRRERNFNAFARVRMHAEAIEKIEFLRQRRAPYFSQTAVFESEVEFALRPENFDG